MYLWTVWNLIIAANIRLLRITRREFAHKGRNRNGRRPNISWWALHQWLSDLLLSSTEGNSGSFSPTETITGSPLQAPTPVEDKSLHITWITDSLHRRTNCLEIVWSSTEEPEKTFLMFVKTTSHLLICWWTNSSVCSPASFFAVVAYMVWGFSELVMTVNLTKRRLTFDLSHIFINQIHSSIIHPPMKTFCVITPLFNDNN